MIQDQERYLEKDLLVLAFERDLTLRDVDWPKMPLPTMPLVRPMGDEGHIWPSG